MDWLKVSILCIITLLVKGGSVEQLPPIVKEPNGVGLVNPVLTETVTENNLHGHDNVNTPVIGQDDGHENVNKPLIGQDDGHENIKKSLIGQDDGHENIKEPLIGQDDGHENVNKPLLGKPDGHDLREHYRSQISHIVTFHPDDHEGSPDDHEGSGTGQKSKESGSDSEDEKEEQRGVEDYDNYDSHKEDTYNNYGEYYDEPLIRCKRPFFCTKYCDDYKTDETGCPICECLENPCEKLECRTGKTCKARECPSRINCKQLTAECVDERPVCAIPMCANYCEEYHYNERGCMTCDCAKTTKAPEQIYQCPEIECIGTVCATGYAKDEHGCTTCTCLDAPVTYPCAEPMCANRCENGYKRNERGCMTCDCVEEDNCSECGSDEVCQHRMEGSETVPFCAPKPLCLLVKEGGDRLAAMNAPNCESDGKFSPLQCKDDQSQCWCVDDRGRVIDGTSTSVYIDEHKPHCVRNRTVSATLRMRLVVIAGTVPGSDYPFTIPDLLESSLTDSLGRCLLMDRQYISVIKTQEMIGGDEAGVVTAASDIGDTVYVETRVRHDGYTDLPSAIEHMKSHIISNDCLVVVESGAVLKPLLDSLDVEYKFSHLPARQQFVTNPDSGLYWTEESWTQYCWSHSYLMVFAALLTGLVLISIILLAVIIARRRRMRMLNFQHQRLQSQLSTTSEKSFLDGRDDNVLLINSGPIEEKTIRA